MVKKNIPFFLITALLSNSLLAQQIFSKKEQAVQQTVVHFFDALTNKDSVALKSNATNDITLYENGKIWNMDSLIRNAITLNTDPAFQRNNSFDFLNTTVRKNIAWVSYNLISQVTLTNRKIIIHFQETIIAVKQKRQWKIKVLHSAVTKRIG